MALGARVITAPTPAAPLSMKLVLPGKTGPSVREIKSQPRRPGCRSRPRVWSRPTFGRQTAVVRSRGYRAACATQTNWTLDVARLLIANGVKAVAEGANMPTTIAATDLFSMPVLLRPGRPRTLAARRHFWPRNGAERSPYERAGRRRKSTPACIISCWIFTTPVLLNTAAKRSRPTSPRRYYRRFPSKWDAMLARGVI